MEKSRTIHIINLNGYLEKNQFAQDLLKHNMEMEPNLEFKIWTEKDPEIQEGLASYTGPADIENYLAYMPGVYLPVYILYKFGGIYCEMDYEFLQKDYFYELYKENNSPIISSPRFRISMCCNNGVIHYFPYSKAKILEVILQLLNYNQQPSYNPYPNNDVFSLSPDRAKKLNFLSEEEVQTIINESKNKFGWMEEKSKIRHYRTDMIGKSDKILICKMSTYLKFRKTRLNELIFEKDGIAFILLNDKNYINVCFDNSLYPKRYNWYNVQDYSFDDVKAFYKAYKTYFDKPIIFLDDLKKILND